MSESGHSPTLQYLWHTVDASQVEWNGLTVHRGVKFPVDSKTVVHVKILSAKPEPQMCVEFQCHNCYVDVQGDVSPATHLWDGEVPPEGITVRFRRIKPEAIALVWPGWVFGRVAESGWKNYGVLIDELGPEHWVLHCAHGLAKVPDFESLVAEVRVLRGLG